MCWELILNWIISFGASFLGVSVFAKLPSVSAEKRAE